MQGFHVKLYFYVYHFMMAVIIGCSIILHLFHPFHQVVVVGYLMIVDARARELFEEPVGTGYLAIFYASQVEG